MRVVLFYLQQILLLGTLGFLVWLLVGWWRTGWFWSNDIHYAWFVALALIAEFLLLVCTPLQIMATKHGNVWASRGLGLVSGPFAVFLHLHFNTRFEVTWENYAVRQALMHFIFAALGLWFSRSYWRRFGPNHSTGTSQ